MEKTSSKARYVVKHPDGSIFESTRAKSAYESQLKLVTGLLFPILENHGPADLIGETVVHAVWGVAANAGFETVIWKGVPGASPEVEIPYSRDRMNVTV